MSKAKYTPGPWQPHHFYEIKAQANTSEELKESWVSWEMPIEGARGEIIGKVSADNCTQGFPSVQTQREMEANLALVCAAPDMLEALMLAYSYWSGEYNHDQTHVKIAISKAIAKATGQEEQS